MGLDLGYRSNWRPFDVPVMRPLTKPSSCEACSAFTCVAACTLARLPIRDPLSEGFRHFVTSMPTPVASGWSESPGGPCTHWKAPPCHGAHPQRALSLCNGNRSSCPIAGSLAPDSFPLRDTHLPLELPM